MASNETNEMAGSWPKVRIGDVAEVFDGPHATPTKTQNGPIFLGISSLNRGRLDLSNTEHLSEEEFVRWTRRVTPRAGDVVFSYETRLGEAAIIPAGLRCCLGRRMGLVRTKPSELDPHFFLYQYLSPKFQELLESRTIHGSTVDRIALKEFPDFEIDLPPLSVQREIAKAMLEIDAKIDLNRRINQTLEAMAQAIFKSWFVDFDPVKAKIAAKGEGRDPLRAAMTAISGKPDAELDTLPPDQFAPLAATAALFPDEMEDSELREIPKGWRCDTFGSIAELSKGSVNPLLSPERVFEHYSLPAFDAGKQPVVEEGVEIKSNKTKFARGAVLQSKLNPHIPRVWFPLRVSENAVCSTEFLPWMAKEPASPSFPYCVLTSDLFGVQVRSLVTGTSNSHQRVKPDQVSGLLTVVPPKDLLRAFTKAVDPFFERVESGTNQMRDLAGLRDALLPKLLSGELHAHGAEAEAAA